MNVHEDLQALAAPGRIARPALVIHVALEGRPKLHVTAQSPQDQERLFRWLRVAPIRERVDDMMALLEDLLELQDAA